MSSTLTWLGHGTWLIESGEHAILIDPFLDDNPAAPLKSENVQATHILISHGHFDHVADAAAIAHRTKAVVVANYEICDWLTKQHQVEKTEPMNIGGSIPLSFGRAKLTPAWHSSVLPDGASGGNPGGWLITLDTQKLYFACDTALFSDMRLIGDEGLDLAVLPIGDRYTMGPDDALAAVKFLRPRRVIPAHYDTWPPISQDAAAWAKRVNKETRSEAVVMTAGEKLSLEPPSSRKKSEKGRAKAQSTRRIQKKK